MKTGVCASVITERVDAMTEGRGRVVNEVAGNGVQSEVLRDLIKQVSYKPGWQFWIHNSNEFCPVDRLMILSVSPDSFDFNKVIRVRHEFMIPPATYNRDVWAAWLFDRVRDVETHEAGEFFRIDGVREFAPHHGNGEDPYRVWHVSDWATASKSSGED